LIISVVKRGLSDQNHQMSSYLRILGDFLFAFVLFLIWKVVFFIETRASFFFSSSSLFFFFFVFFLYFFFFFLFFVVLFFVFLFVMK